MNTHFVFKKGNLVKFVIADYPIDVCHPDGLRSPELLKLFIEEKDIYEAKSSDVGLITGLTSQKCEMTMYQVYVAEGFWWFCVDNLIPHNL